jgi:Zn finger protein HypA/HybF involved in hydrogenase expression
MKYVDFNDTTIAVGKRKVAYVKWAVHKGTDLIKAKMMANKKFGKVEKYKCNHCDKVFILDDYNYKAFCPYCDAPND